MNRMAFLLTIAVLAAHPSADAAIADRARLPPDQAQHAVYLSMRDCPPESWTDLENALRFIVPSLSSGVYLADQLPQRVGESDLLRLQLDGLGWQATYPQVLATHYVPTYRPDLIQSKSIPLVMPALAFAATIIDPIETGNSQDLLLYGAKPPKTADEFLKFWGISNDSDLVFGLIEGKSGVANQRIRLIENRPGSRRNVGWLTRDSEVVAGKKDPLENLPNKVAFDAQELIVQFPKWSGGESGYLQSYFLADGKGAVQRKAPAAVVVDHVGLRGPEIRNWISCVTCHTNGINEPTEDAFRAYIESGASVGFLKKDEQRRVDQYLTSDIAKEVEDCQEKYADGIRLVNGLTPEKNLQAFMNIVRLYDAPVTLEQAARELYCEPKELQLALADYSRAYSLSGRLSILAQGKPVTRPQWKSNYAFAQQVLYRWKQQN